MKRVACSLSGSTEGQQKSAIAGLTWNEFTATTAAAPWGVDQVSPLPTQNSTFLTSGISCLTTMSFCDMAETSTTWSKIDDLYENVRGRLADALSGDEHQYWLGCHMSHSYHTGAALYFTFGFRCKIQANGEVDQHQEFLHYLKAKRVVLDAFQTNDATLSHHHAVGYEHLPWLASEASLTVGTLIDAVKPALDPEDIMNPGKLRSGYTIAEWQSRGLPAPRPSQ